METSIGVFGEQMLLWICMLRQSPQRPPPDHVYRQANLLLDELKASKIAQELPIQSVDDGMFVIAALLDETAMSLPDLRPLWAQHPLQATRWTTHNAGVEVFERLARVREGPRNVIATYAVVIGLGFMGRFGLPGQNPYALVQIRRELSIQLGVDPDRDWSGGVLKPPPQDAGPSEHLQKEPWFRSVGVGRVIAVVLLLGGVLALVLLIKGKMG